MSEPVTAVVVVRWRGVLLEQMYVYSAHESCAITAGEAEAKRLAVKYDRFVQRQAAELEIKWGVSRP